MNPITGPYKRAQCRHFERKGFCNLGDRCSFAHGQDDINSPHIVRFIWTTSYGDKRVEIWALAFSVKKAREMLDRNITAFLQDLRKGRESLPLIAGVLPPETDRDFAWWRSLLGLILTTEPETGPVQMVGGGEV